MTTLSPTSSLIAAHSGRLRLVAILMIVFGILAMLTPLVAAIAIVYMVGALVLAAGVARSVLAFTSGSFGYGAILLLVGVVMVIGGIAILTHLLLTLMVITLLLAVYFGAVGIASIAAAFRIRPAPPWTLELINGIVSLILGLLIWAQWPVSGDWAIGLLLGIHLLFTGIELLGLASATSRGAAAAA